MRLFGFLGSVGTDHWVRQVPAYAQTLEPGCEPLSSWTSGNPPAACWAPHVETIDATTLAVQGGPIWYRGTEGTYQNKSPVALLQAYRTQGPAVLDRLAGRFALAVIDPAQRQVILAIDPMGIERLIYCVRRDGIVFGSSAERVARCPGISPTLNRQALYDYLLLHIVPAPATAYAQVQKLRPGTAAIFKDGLLEIHRYWQPGFREQPTPPFDTLKAQLQENLRAAVEACAPNERTGAFLSGGLDSSSVAGMLTRVQGRPAQTFSIGFGVDAYDELSYARIANGHFRSQGHEYHVTPDDIVTAFHKIAHAYDEPFGNSSAVPTYFCARLAREHGIDHLLAGDGGDEIFGGNERYVRQQIFERYFSIPGWIRSALIEPLAHAVRADSALSPLRKLRSYVDQANVRLPERFETWNLIYREGAERAFDPDFLDGIDPHAPLATMREVFEEIPAISLLNRMLFYDWHYTLSDNDLRKVSTMCALAGVRVSYPMLDPRVVDLSVRVPSSLKIKGTELRWFYRRAMADFLPAEILAKRKHGFGLPFGVWLKTHAPLRELIFGHLNSLRQRRIIHHAFIDQIIARHHDGDASFYGYPIWDMAMLDAWLERHAVAA